MKTQAKTFLWIGVLSVMAASVMTGCKTRTSGIEGGGAAIQTPEGDTQLSKFVVINNTKLARGIQVVDIKSQFAGDLLKAQVNIVNKYSATLKFQYKFAWFNSNGMEVNADGPWLPLVLSGNESKTLQAVAPNAAAREFKIKINAR
jgi:uncharacterized protein YcfL